MAPTMGLENKCHSAWCEYGFPEQVTYENFYSLYRRGGIAHGAVEKLVGKCWQTNPEIIEGDQADKKRKETAWEKRPNRYSPTDSGVHSLRPTGVVLLVDMHAFFFMSATKKTGIFR